MSNTKVYQYPQCSTCRKAVKWLNENEITFTSIHIVEESPKADELREIIEKSGLPFKKFFNTSGKKYRELGLKDRLPSMDLDEAVQVLVSDGMLIKRPLLVQGEKVMVGFREEEWNILS